MAPAAQRRYGGTAAQRTAAALPVDRRYVIAAAALALPTVALSLLARAHDTVPLDAAIMARVRALGSSYKPAAELFNEYNGYIALTSVAFGAALMLVRRRPDAALLFMVAAASRPCADGPRPRSPRSRRAR